MAWNVRCAMERGGSRMRPRVWAAAWLGAFVLLLAACHMSEHAPTQLAERSLAVPDQRPITAIAHSPRPSFRDCPQCPEMVDIPAGEFAMGSPDSELGRNNYESPLHQVHVSAFSLGQYDVTFAEWDACLADGGCTKLPSDQGWGRGSRPVIWVSWSDTQQYTRWLSKKTGHDYRLPSEAEWEHAARAGTETAYYWGKEIGEGNANCYGCGSEWDEIQTAPVGSFPPNPWGLYDMGGNVEQWVGDCWHDDYTNAPLDGGAWTTQCQYGKTRKGMTIMRVVRGGSFDYAPVGLRSAARAGELHENYFVGFRVARSPLILRRH